MNLVGLSELVRASCKEVFHERSKLFFDAMFCSFLIFLMVFPSKHVSAWSGGTIYINPRGDVSPIDAPIVRRGDVYYLTSDVESRWDGIVIEKDNIILDGQNHTITGNGVGDGIRIHKRQNVSVKNVRVKTFYRGININSSFHIKIVGSAVSNNEYGIGLLWSSSNSIVNNTISDNIHYGIFLLTYSCFNKILKNNVSNSAVGIGLLASSFNEIINNIVQNNSYRGIDLYNSENNNIVNNTISNNKPHGIVVDYSSNNVIHHNNFIDNAHQVHIWNSQCLWDDGSCGNYWSDYKGSDSDSNGIGDVSYVIDSNNVDRYPLMKSIGLSKFEVGSLSLSPDSVKVGESTKISVEVKNTGKESGFYHVTLVVDNKIVETKSIKLDAGKSTVVSFTYTPKEEGTYGIDVNGLKGSLSVRKEMPLWLVVIFTFVIIAIVLLRKKFKYS